MSQDPLLPPPNWVDTTVKAALRAIPYAGPSLSVIFEDSRARHAARVQQFATDVATDVSSVDHLEARLRTDEDTEIIFLRGVEIAVKTGMAEKRRYLARVVARAVEDSAQVEPAQLVLDALEDLDRPHLAALTRLRAVERDASKRVGEDTSEGYEYVRQRVIEASFNEPVPIRSALIRTGVAYQATLVGGGIAVYGITAFGDEVLDDLDLVAKWL